ncbi:MAG: heme lyase CcmF/NrfE family subunit, partial [Gemmatimonadota bacterium]|nr:heme lyase CcmF/NrfE family subunit [Gemmatimonadota bacterium]
LALLLSAWGAVVGYLGGRRGDPALIQSARRTTYALMGLLTVASLALVVALLKNDFNVTYVASYSSRNLPTAYKLSAFYGGQAGSLLFWAWVLTLFAAAAQWVTGRRYAYLLPYVAAVTSVVTLFFVSVTLFGANPFERLDFTPMDGRGLNPQLQNPGMVIHPPMLYLGYVSITIPFAFAVAALLSRRLDVGWLHAIRKWTLLSWVFLSVGITLGMWWAYVELGWGGYWAWDPVENASFLPWLTMTAFLHSVMIQEKRGMLKRWNVILVGFSFALSIFGTFITRSGIISSVHSFAQSPVGTFFAWFLLLGGVFMAWLTWSRWDLLQTEARLESALSREASFFFNNLLLVGMAFSVLWGTVFPMISELVRGTQVTVGPPFFNQVNIPIGLALLALTGIGPLIAWRKASPGHLRRQFLAPVGVALVVGAVLAARGMSDAYALLALVLAAFVTATIGLEFWRGVGARHRLHGEHYALAFARLVGRNRRRYGGYIVHLGIVTYFVGFTGAAFKTELEASLKPGESVTMQSPYGEALTFTHLGVSQYEALNRFVSAASVEIQRDGERIGILTSEKRQHVDSFGRASFEPSTEAAIKSDLREDLYVVYAGSVDGTEEAVYKFTINPLVMWVWLGGAILVLGGMVTMWPGGGPTDRAAQRALEGYRTQLAATETAAS